MNGRWLVAFCAPFLLTALPATARPAAIDTIAFGDSASEQSHALTAVRSEPIEGGLNQPSRQLLPLDSPSWDGGKVAFTMKVDPEKPTYFTIKLWGDDRGEERGRLLLFCEGKQVGTRHIGDVDCLDILANEPRFPGRFVYSTTTLPKAMTKGKQSVQVEVRALGRIWGYGDTWETFQRKLEQPSRGIYRAYTHTDPYFVPPADEKQGAPRVDPPKRTGPGPEVLDHVKDRVNGEISKLLAAERINQMQMQFLARAYHVKWTPAYHNAKVVDKLVEALDKVYVAYRANPHLAASDRETYNADWFGLGPSGDVIRLIDEPIKPYLDQPIKGTDNNSSRRAGWAEMLVDCRDWHRQHRRLYTNQSMINDLYGIYLANRGVEILDPAKAMREKDVRRYLYESVGLEPWRDSDPGGEGVAPEIAGHRNWGIGDNYMELTAKGLSKELGYVGSYGEVLDWVCSIYNATRPTLDQP